MLIRPSERLPHLRLTGQTCGNYDITSDYEFDFRAYRSCMDRLQKEDKIIFEVSFQSGSYSTLEYVYTVKDMGYVWYIDAI